MLVVRERRERAGGRRTRERAVARAARRGAAQPPHCRNVVWVRDGVMRSQDERGAEAAGLPVVVSERVLQCVTCPPDVLVGPSAELSNG